MKCIIKQVETCGPECLRKADLKFGNMVIGSVNMRQLIFILLRDIVGDCIKVSDIILKATCRSVNWQ